MIFYEKVLKVFLQTPKGKKDCSEEDGCSQDKFDPSNFSTCLAYLIEFHCIYVGIRLIQ